MMFGSGDLDALLYRELFLAIELVAQRLTLDAGHDIIKERVGCAGVEQRENMGMLQVGCNFDFLEEPLRTDDRRQLRMQNLDGNFAVVFEILRGIDGGHAAGTEFTLEGVTIGKGRREAVKGVGHRPLKYRSMTG